MQTYVGTQCSELGLSLIVQILDSQVTHKSLKEYYMVVAASYFTLVLVHVVMYSQWNAKLHSREF